ncbi:MAG TPA: hypothetical protein DEH02_13320 [Bacteroidales bacterium]|nr:MAG: hypothetical protein A2X01_13610 [Bacteroidetes bacterium GWF2_35_48]HBX52040.1 hypothetical protein [Bacteroidales bacterium]
MAIVQNPITGRTKKKFGTAVFSKQFGKNTMRTKPIEVRNPKTLLQKQQRSKFTLMVELSRMFLGFIRIGFKQVSTSMSQFNSFMKTNIYDVITGTYPNYSIDFTKLIVTKGTLTGADEGIVTAEAGHKVSFAWTDNTGTGDAQATDKAMQLIINYDKGAVVQDTTNKTRADGSSQLTVPLSWVGDQVHVYLSFMTPAADRVADSTFLGTITIVV